MIARGANTDILIDGKILLGKIIIDSEHHGNLFVVGVGFEELVKGTLSKPFAWYSKFNLKATGANGQNVLHDCCCADYYNQQIFMTLVAKGVDPFAKDRNGDTPVSLVYKKTAETEGRRAATGRKKAIRGRDTEKHAQENAQQTVRQQAVLMNAPHAPLLAGVDTGGTYTDAAVIEAEATRWSPPPRR